MPRRCEPLITAMQGQGPHFLPTRKPQSTSTGGRGGRGSKWAHYIGEGVGGLLPNLDHIYIYMCVCVHAIVYMCAILDHVHTVFRCCHTIRIIVDTLFFVFGSTCCMIFMYLYHLYIYIHISTSNLHVIPLFVV